jgi:ribonuclease-3
MGGISAGEKMTGGAFEALIGALYCEFGIELVAEFIDGIMGGVLRYSFSCSNAIGELQEYFQKQGKPLPEYSEISRTGPEHRPFFTVRVATCDGLSGEGKGLTLSDAKQDSARQVLDRIGIVRRPFP